MVQRLGPGHHVKYDFGGWRIWKVSESFSWATFVWKGKDAFLCRSRRLLAAAAEKLVKVNFHASRRFIDAANFSEDSFVANQKVLEIEEKLDNALLL